MSATRSPVQLFDLEIRASGFELLDEFYVHFPQERNGHADLQDLQSPPREIRLPSFPLVRISKTRENPLLGTVPEFQPKQTSSLAVFEFAIRFGPTRRTVHLFDFDMFPLLTRHNLVDRSRQ